MCIRDSFAIDDDDPPFIRIEDVSHLVGDHSAAGTGSQDEESFHRILLLMISD
jgi:hypothetical protein